MHVIPDTIRAMKLRLWALGVVRQVGQSMASVGQGEWVRTDGPQFTGRNARGWRARRPRRFGTVEDLAGLCDDLRGVLPVVTVVAGNGVAYSDDFATAAREISRRPGEDRCWISVRGSDETSTGVSPARSATVLFESRKGRVGTNVEIDGDTQIVSSQFMQLLDKYTEPLPRRDARRGRPLIAPVTIEAADQRKHDRRVAKIGGWLGFAGGVIGGAISGWLAAALSGSGS